MPAGLSHNMRTPIKISPFPIGHLRSLDIRSLRCTGGEAVSWAIEMIWLYEQRLKGNAKGLSVRKGDGDAC